MRAKMAAHLANNAKHRHGRPDYSIAKFGLDDAGLASDFAAYKADFGV